MPSERFYRLSEEKQFLIWKASMKEFIAQPFEKVSINKIIKEAGISRGSFYTYFEDKRDLLSFLLRDTERKWKEFCLDCLGKTDGDIVSTMERMMEFGLEFCKNNDLFRLHKNLAVYPDTVLSECIETDIIWERTIGEEFFEKVNRDGLRDDTPEGVTRLMRLCIAAMMDGFVEYYKNPEREAKIKEEYKKMLDILRHGACKSSEKQGGLGR